MFKNAQQAWKSCLLSAADEYSKKKKKKKFQTTRGLLDNWNSFKRPMRNVNRSSRLFLFSSKGNVSNTNFAEVSVADLYIYASYCVYTLGPMPLLLYPLFPLTTVTPQPLLSSGNWPQTGLPLICQSSLDEAGTLNRHSTDCMHEVQFSVLVIRSNIFDNSCITSSEALEGAGKVVVFFKKPW